MMIGKMFMMRGGNGNQHGNDTTDHREHDTPAQWQDPASTIPAELSPQTLHFRHVRDSRRLRNLRTSWSPSGNPRDLQQIFIEYRSRPSCTWRIVNA
jgi:hypothetical protein